MDPASVRLEGLHHITMVTADAQANVDFCVGVLGLRLVKQTVNFDAPDMYHLYYGDDVGSAGSLLTWFEIRGARRGRAGAGMVYLLELAVPSVASLDFWLERLDDMGVTATRSGDRVEFTDPDGLAFALVPATLDNAPLQAAHPDIPAEHAIIGMEGARTYSTSPGVDCLLLTNVFGFRPCDARSRESDDSFAEYIGGGDDYLLEGHERSFRWGYDTAPREPGMPGAGTVHHIAWCSRDEDHTTWQARERAAGLYATPVIDRDYFDAVYARVPSGILFEIATMGPGFAVDEDIEELGTRLQLPKQYAAQRAQIEASLTPLRNPTKAAR